uniref:Variable surface glycoprotein n=1 Tax=Trypanosoma brucei rhodesiense TaxID=31286 RepID=O96638_TRYBR|nr:variable surface glycoprotein [Trypanosoma brucei rhodesiense]
MEARMPLNTWLRMLPLLLLMPRLSVQQAAIYAAQNAPAFAAMCDLARYLYNPPPMPTKVIIKNADYKEILKRNMSLAPTDWKKIFYDEENPKQWRTKPAAKGADAADWQNMFQDWLDAIQALEEQPGNQKKINYYKELSTQQRLQARQQLKELAATAAALAQEQEPPEPASSIIDAPDYKEKLKKLFLGNADKTPNNVAATDIYSTTGIAGTSRDTVCTSGAAQNTPKTLATAMACICAPETAGEVEDICYNNQGSTNKWVNNGADNINVLKAIAQKCLADDSGEHPVRDPSDLIQSIVKLTTTTGGNTYIGAFKTNCNGQQASGRCMKWSGKKPHEITSDVNTPWLKDVAELGRTIRARTKNNQIKEHKLQILRNLARTAKSLESKSYYEPIEQLRHDAAAQPKSSGADTKTTENTEKECETIQKAEDCRNNANCKWESTDEKDGKHCKAKDGEGQTNTAGAGTDSKTNTTGSNSFVIKKAPLLLAVLLF